MAGPDTISQHLHLCLLHDFLGRGAKDLVTLFLPHHHDQPCNERDTLTSGIGLRSWCPSSGHGMAPRRLYIFKLFGSIQIIFNSF